MKFVTSIMFALVLAPLAHASVDFSKSTPSDSTVVGKVRGIVVRASADTVQVQIEYPYLVAGSKATYTGQVSFTGADKASGMAFGAMIGNPVTVSAKDSYILVESK